MTFILGRTSFHMQTAGASVMESVVPCSHDNTLLSQPALPQTVCYCTLNPLIHTYSQLHAAVERRPIHAGSCLFGNFLFLFR